MTIFYKTRSVYGLQGFDDCDCMEKLLSIFHQQIKANCVDGGQAMTNQAISNILFGMKGMSCKSDVVKKIISILTQQILESEKTNQLMTTQEIGMSIYSLHNKNSESDEVRRLINALIGSYSLHVKFLCITLPPFPPTSSFPSPFLLSALVQDKSINVITWVRRQYQCPYMRCKTWTTSPVRCWNW